MSDRISDLYAMLPALYRIRDSEGEGALKELLTVIGEQIVLLEDDFQQLYDDQFIETCAEWVVPYIGDLIGHRPLHSEVSGVASPRAEVANTIAYRRRKGTAAMLEQLARDVTGWPTRVVEFFQLIGTTQFLDNVRLGHAQVPDLRKTWELASLDGPFESIAHTAEVRSCSRSGGKYNIPNIGIFLCRVPACEQKRTRPWSLDSRRYTFHTLGVDTALFNRPVREETISHLAERENLPLPIRDADALGQYLGPRKSFMIYTGSGQVEAEDIVFCALPDSLDSGGAVKGWKNMPSDCIAVDPQRGRIAFPVSEAPPEEVEVVYHYGFPADLGGGPYERRDSFNGAQTATHSVSHGVLLQTALDAAQDGGIVEISDSQVYEEALAVHAHAGTHIEFRAANTQRPTILLSGELLISGGEDAEVSLNGLLIGGASLRVPAMDGDGNPNNLRRLTLRHCTIAHGLGLTRDGVRIDQNAVSMIVEKEGVEIVLDACVLGPLRSAAHAEFTMHSCIVSTGDSTASAYEGLSPGEPGAGLRMTACTVIGTLYCMHMKLISNSIIDAVATEDGVPVHADRRQDGCVRFTWLPPTSVVPRRHRCQPELEIGSRLKKLEARAAALGTIVSPARKQAEAASVRGWLVPSFLSLRYGDYSFCRLRDSAPGQLHRGADDESEMGAYHDVYAPQRAINLRIRLREYLRFGLEAGLFHAT